MSIFYYIGIALALASNLLFCKKFDSSRLRAGLYTLCFVYGVLGAFLAELCYRYICDAVGAAAPYGFVAMFGAVILPPPLIMLTAAIEWLILRRYGKNDGPVKSLKAAVSDTVDMLTPDIFLVLTAAKFGCHFDGCCYGVPFKGGIYSAAAGTQVFPVQIAEAATTLIILAVSFCLWHTRFFRRGMAYPLTAAMYCAARFCWEFARYYPDELRHAFFGMTFWQCCCIAVGVCSVVSVVILCRTRPADPLPKRKPKRKQNIKK